MPTILSFVSACVLVCVNIFWRIDMNAGRGRVHWSGIQSESRVTKRYFHLTVQYRCHESDNSECREQYYYFYNVLKSCHLLTLVLMGFFLVTNNTSSQTIPIRHAQRQVSAFYACRSAFEARVYLRDRDRKYSTQLNRTDEHYSPHFRIINYSSTSAIILNGPQRWPIYDRGSVPVSTSVIPIPRCMCIK